jgi:hypothetical protein
MSSVLASPGYGVHYVYRSRPDTDFGPLELTFGGRRALFDNAADGEALRVRRIGLVCLLVAAGHDERFGEDFPGRRFREALAAVGAKARQATRAASV